MFGVSGIVTRSGKVNFGSIAPIFTSEAEVDTVTTGLQDMASSQTTLVAVGGINGGSPTTICRYSGDDGVTWNNATITAGKPLTKVRYANGVWVAAGDFSGFGGSQDAHIFTSTDGQTWTSRLNTATASDSVLDLAYSPTHNLWVITIDRADTPVCYTASDPTGTWTQRTLPDPGNAGGDFATDIIDTGVNLFIIGFGLDGSFDLAENYLWKTVDGITWQSRVLEGLNQTLDLFNFLYVPVEDVFTVIDSPGIDLAYYTNNAGFPGTRTLIDTTVAGSFSSHLDLNLAGGVFASYQGTWGIATSDGVTSYNRYQVDGGGGLIVSVCQHKLQYFCCGFDNGSSNGVTYELFE